MKLSLHGSAGSLARAGSGGNVAGEHAAHKHGSTGSLARTGSGGNVAGAHAVQTPPRRRFMRVVRDENARPPEVIDDNPHVIVKYTQSFLEKHYKETSHLQVRMVSILFFIGCLKTLIIF